MSDYKVEMVNDGMSEFYVEFHGPRDSKLPFHVLIFADSVLRLSPPSGR